MDLKKVISNYVKTDFKEVLLGFNGWDTLSFKLSAELARGATIYPSTENIFRAFNYFNLGDTKAVIVGQDCYHTPRVADGLAFSTNAGFAVPPSLSNIYKEIKRDYPDSKVRNGDLTRWAQQGILLLNMALTVRRGEAGSHSHLWADFARYMIQQLSGRTEHVVFLLWGRVAKSNAMLIDEERHCVLTAGHPSPLSVRHFEKCGHFKAANDYLSSHGVSEIEW